MTDVDTACGRELLDEVQNFLGVLNIGDLDVAEFELVLSRYH